MAGPAGRKQTHVPLDIIGARHARAVDPTDPYSGLRRDARGGLANATGSIPSPRWFPVPEAQDFFGFATLAVVTGPGTTAVLSLPRGVINVASQNVAVVRSLTYVINSMLPTTDVFFTLRFNEAPVQGFDRLQAGPRSAASVGFSFTPEEVMIDVPEGSKIDQTVTVVDPGTYQVSASFKGWWYPKDVWDRWQQMWG